MLNTISTPKKGGQFFLILTLLSLLIGMISCPALAADEIRNAVTVTGTKTWGNDNDVYVGPVTISSGATLNLGGKWRNLSSNSVTTPSNVVFVNNGTLNYNGKQYEQPSGYNYRGILRNNSGATANFNGTTFNLNAYNSASMFYISGNSTVNFNGITLNQNHSSTSNNWMNIQSNGTLNLVGNNTFNKINNSSGVYNYGQINIKKAADADSAITTFADCSNLYFLNYGKINVQDGAELKFSNSVTRSNNLITVEDGGTLTFSGGTLDMTNLYASTGIIVKNGGTLVIDGTTVQNAGYYGYSNNNSYIRIEEGGKLEIKGNATVQNNRNYSSTGSLFYVNDGEVIIGQSTFRNNTAPNGSGSVFVITNGTDMTINGATFENNTAKSGGAIRITGSTLTIDEGTKFTGNQATKDTAYSDNIWEGGGAIFATDSVLNILKAEFNGNTAGLVGGAICQEGGELNLGDPDDDTVIPVFKENKAIRDTITGQNYGNYAVRGGAIALDVYCTADNPECKEPKGDLEGTVSLMNMTVHNALFESNSAIFQGGALMIGYAGVGDPRSYSTNTNEITVVIHKGDFKNNAVTYNYNQGTAGGAIMNMHNGVLRMDNVLMRNNKTNGAGGAIAACNIGRTFVFIRNGSAIFDNEASIPGDNLKDIYLFDEIETHKIGKLMFNGKPYNWNEQLGIQRQGKEGGYYGAMPAEGDTPSDEDAMVRFIGNEAFGICWGDNCVTNGHGGAIATNGILIIGEDTEEILIEKTWEDNDNAEIIIGDAEQAVKPRPSAEDFVKGLVLKADGVEYPLGELVTTDMESPYTFTADPDGDNYDKYITVIVTEDETDTNLWTVEIIGLPKTTKDPVSGADVDIIWTVEENIANYLSVAKTPSDEAGDPVVEPGTDASSEDEIVAFAFTNKLNVVNISGEKTWSGDDAASSTDGQDHTGNRPETVTIHLHGDNDDLIREIEITKPSEGWEDSTSFVFTYFEDEEGTKVPLPKYDEEGLEIEYSIHEEWVNHYTPHVSYNEDTDVYTIKNEYTPWKRNLEVIKAWHDDDNRDGLRPIEVTVTLLKKNQTTGEFEDTGKTCTIKHNEAEHVWNCIFENVDIYYQEPAYYDSHSTEGDEIVYDVKESDIQNYEMTSKIGRSETGVWTITNTHEIAQADVTITKKWVGDDIAASYNHRPEVLEFLNALTLLADDEPYSLGIITEDDDNTTENVYIGHGSAGDVTITFFTETDNNTWTVKYEGLPKNKLTETGEITWTVSEIKPVYYTQTVNGLEITNTLNQMRLTINKTWNDGGETALRPSAQTLLDGAKLYYKIEGSDVEHALDHGTFVPVEGTTNQFKVSNHENLLVTVETTVTDKPNEWLITVDYLPTKFIVYEPVYDPEYPETVTELKQVEHFVTDWILRENTAGYAPAEGTTKVNEPVINITNNALTDIAVTKTWVDPEGTSLNHPAVTIKLMGNGQEKGELTLSDGSWTGVFEGLPKYDDRGTEITYTIEETVSAPGYTTTYDGYQVINTATNITQITVNKVWVGDEEDESTRPESVTVILQPVGTEAVLTQEQDWTHTFEGLSIYDEAGEVIDYSIEEVRIDHYDSAVGEVTDGVVTITNTYVQTPPTPPTPELPDGPFFFRLGVLPRTGFSSVRPTALSAQPKEISYKPESLVLQIPSLDVKADVVTVPYVNGEYPVEWLGMQAGMLEGSAKPGEGYTILTGHNTLNTTEVGPFAFLSYMEEGDMIFLLNKYNQLKPYTVYAVEKISANDSAALERIARMDENSLTMLTCEDELPEGGYASRRVVAARPLGTW